ncbi:30298_t:CDS:2, partial [Gigaspora margarita]
NNVIVQKEEDLPNPTPTNYQAWYQGPSPYGTKGWYLPTALHFSLKVINRAKTVYMIEQKGFCLIAHDPRNLLVPQEWILAGIRQELV